MVQVTGDTVVAGREEERGAVHTKLWRLISKEQNAAAESKTPTNLRILVALALFVAWRQVQFIVAVRSTEDFRSLHGEKHETRWPIIKTSKNKIPCRCRID